MRQRKICSKNLRQKSSTKIVEKILTKNLTEKSGHANLYLQIFRVIGRHNVELVAVGEEFDGVHRSARAPGAAAARAGDRVAPEHVQLLELRVKHAAVDWREMKGAYWYGDKIGY